MQIIFIGYFDDFPDEIYFNIIIWGKHPYHEAKRPYHEGKRPYHEAKRPCTKETLWFSSSHSYNDLSSTLSCWNQSDISIFGNLQLHNCYKAPFWHYQLPFHILHYFPKNRTQASVPLKAMWYSFRLFIFEASSLQENFLYWVSVKLYLHLVRL